MGNGRTPFPLERKETPYSQTQSESEGCHPEYKETEASGLRVLLRADLLLVSSACQPNENPLEVSPAPAYSSLCFALPRQLLPPPWIPVPDGHLGQGALDHVVKNKRREAFICMPIKS